MKQLDVGMSPPANIMSFSLTDPCHSSDMNYCPVNFCLVILSQTDGQTESDAYEPTVHEHRWAKK